MSDNLKRKTDWGSLKLQTFKLFANVNLVIKYICWANLMPHYSPFNDTSYTLLETLLRNPILYSVIV